MKPESIERRIAYFISPHGFGHAARSAAIMEAAHLIDNHLRFEIFTRTPEWFFQRSLTRAFGYHTHLTDIGLAQKTPFEIDLPKTLRELDDFLPFDSDRVEAAARLIQELKCELVVCDISPLGIKAAESAHVPAVLVENFTWDWIYEAHAHEDPRMQLHADYLREVFRAAQYHVQTEPVSVPRTRAFTVPPVSRAPVASAGETRKRLGVPERARVVLITMGGIAVSHRLNQLEKARDIFFVIPGGSQSHEVRGHFVLLPFSSDFYHPDLVNASDAVVCKIGYSTVAESYHANVPVCYVTRPEFRESETLAKFIERHMRGRAVSQEEFESGSWLGSLEELLREPRAYDKRPNGAGRAAAFLCSLLEDNARAAYD